MNKCFGNGILAAVVLVACAGGVKGQAGGAPPREQKWELALGRQVMSSPAVGGDGTIYFTLSGAMNAADASGGKLVAVTPGGRELWRFQTPSEIKSSPAVGSDGTIYFGSRDRKFYAIDHAGREKWAFKTGDWIEASPAILTNGVVCFGSWDHKFYALNADGSKRWDLATGGPVDSSAAIGADGTIYFGSHDRKLYAVNPDGKVRWTFATGGAIISSPAIQCDGTIYFTSVDGKLYALNPDGSLKWALWTGGVRGTSPVIGAEGNIYLGVNDVFCAIKEDGIKIWEFGHPMIDGAAAVAADGLVYFCGIDAGVGVLYGFSSTGELKTYTPLNGVATGSPTIAADGTIYVGASQLQAYQGTGGPAKSCWPKFRGAASQSGRAGAE